MSNSKRFGFDLEKLELVYSKQLVPEEPKYVVMSFAAA